MLDTFTQDTLKYGGIVVMGLFPFLAELIIMNNTHPLYHQFVGLKASNVTISGWTFRELQLLFKHFGIEDPMCMLFFYMIFSRLPTLYSTACSVSVLSGTVSKKDIINKIFASKHQALAFEAAMFFGVEIGPERQSILKILSKIKITTEMNQVNQLVTWLKLSKD